MGSLFCIILTIEVGHAFEDGTVEDTAATVRVDATEEDFDAFNAEDAIAMTVSAAALATSLEMGVFEK